MSPRRTQREAGHTFCFVGIFFSITSLPSLGNHHKILLYKRNIHLYTYLQRGASGGQTKAFPVSLLWEMGPTLQTARSAFSSASGPCRVLGQPKSLSYQRVLSQPRAGEPSTRVRIAGVGGRGGGGRGGRGVGAGAAAAEVRGLAVGLYSAGLLR